MPERKGQANAIHKPVCPRYQRVLDVSPYLHWGNGHWFHYWLWIRPMSVWKQIDAEYSASGPYLTPHKATHFQCPCVCQNGAWLVPCQGNKAMCEVPMGYLLGDNPKFPPNYPMPSIPNIWDSWYDAAYFHSCAWDAIRPYNHD